MILPTRTKIFLAKIIYKIIHFFIKNDNHIITRNQINYDIDLSEGIDLSLFLFGFFQKNICKSPYLALNESSIIIDVGANIGIMTLNYAQIAINGHVYAFEPTDYAYNKLVHNVTLNKELAKNITIEKSFISSNNSDTTTKKAYSSWKLNGINNTHPIHYGKLMEISDTKTITIDGYIDSANIKKIDLIKIDTDGHELDVLKGAKNSIKKFKPAIIFEIGLYFFKENNCSFNDYFIFFKECGYTLKDLINYKTITIENYTRSIPKRGTTDILAIYNNE